MGIGEFPQQAENRFRVTKALLAEVWYLREVTINSNTVNTDMYDKTEIDDFPNCKKKARI